MNRQEPGERWRRLLEEERNSKASQFVKAWEWLRLSHYVLNENYRELLLIPEIFNRQTELAAVSRRSEEDALLIEFMRRLHNYLASVKSLVDHTRRFRRRYITGQELNQKIEIKVNELRSDPDVTFLQRLRHPVQHSHLPEIALVTTFPNGTMKRQLMMGVDELVQYGERNWSKKEVEYIRDNKEGYYEDSQSIDISAAVERYQLKIESFYKWLYNTIQEANMALLEEHNRRVEEIIRVEGQLRDISGRSC